MIATFDGWVNGLQFPAMMTGPGVRDCSQETCSVTTEQLVARFGEMYSWDIQAELLQHCKQRHPDGHVVVKREQWDKATA